MFTRTLNQLVHNSQKKISDFVGQVAFIATIIWHIALWNRDQKKPFLTQLGKSDPTGEVTSPEAMVTPSQLSQTSSMMDRKHGLRKPQGQNLLDKYLLCAFSPLGHTLFNFSKSK